MTDDRPRCTAGAEVDLSFLRAPLPDTFQRRRIVLTPGRPRLYDSSEWRDALVVVEHGRLHLECHGGGFRTFGEGAVVTLDGLALRALHNRGPGPAVLVAVCRRSVPNGSPLSMKTRGPRILELPDRPYIGVRRTVTMASIALVVDRIPEIVEHLVGRGSAPTGAPFLRYHLIDMDRSLEVEAGVPVDDTTLADGEVTAGNLPAGRFVVARHLGHPDGLVDATTTLLRWAADQGLVWDRSVTGEGERWGCRAEHFLTPLEQPDPHRGETELAFRLA